MEEHMTKEKLTLSVGTWVAIGSLTLAISGAIAAALTNVFVTKSELHSVELSEAQKSGKDDVRDWRIQTLEVRTGNLESRAERTDKNVVRLLERFRVRPVDEPQYTPLPPRPDLDNPSD
jgi:hypothetical protein